MTNPRRMRLAAVGLLVLIGALVAAPAAHASVSISLAELSGTQLRIEGQAIANRTITVDGVAMGTSDGAGNFRIQRDPFAKPADCIVQVNDGSASPTPATLSGCTVTTAPAQGATGTISIVPGNNGSGQITSQPAGINCAITGGNGSGTCNAFFPAGTVVRLDAIPAADSSFLGWRGLPGCQDPANITVVANTIISCQPAFSLNSATLTVNPPPPSGPFGVSLNPSTVVAGSSSQGTITFSSPVSAATTVSLGSGNTAASVPASVTVPAGSATATFTVATTSVSGPITLLISATAGGVTQFASLSIAP